MNLYTKEGEITSLEKGDIIRLKLRETWISLSYERDGASLKNSSYEDSIVIESKEPLLATVGIVAIIEALCGLSLIRNTKVFTNRELIYHVETVRS